MNRRPGKINGLITVAVCMAVTFGCAPAVIPVITEPETTMGQTSVYETSSETSAQGQTLIASDTEGRFLYYRENPAPVFAYNQEYGELIAYCYESGSSHLPYVLSKREADDDSGYTKYIPEFNRSVKVLFDSEYGVWRVFTSPVGAESDPETEWIIYNDREYIVDRAANLRREAAPGAKPRYYSIESGLYYFLDEGGLTLAVDMNGDGATEMLSVIPEGYGKNKTADFSVRLNGEAGFVIEDVLSFSGAYVTDVDEGDDWKEVVFEYRDSKGESVCEIMRYDGNRIRSEILKGSIDCAGNRVIYQRTEETGNIGEAPVTYEVDEYFMFRKT